MPNAKNHIILGTCNCGTSMAALCTEPLFLDRNNSIRVQGMFIGCLPLTSLMYSTLECFFNGVCLAQVMSAMHAPHLNISTLDRHQLSRYQPNTPLNEVMNNLMTENWTSSINYTRYFAECSPNECTYPIKHRNSIGYVLLKILGLCKLDT